MIALLIALSFAAHPSHAHRSHADRCSKDAERVQALESQIEEAANPEAELERLESRLIKAISQAERDCG